MSEVLDAPASIDITAPCDLRPDLGDFSSIVCFRALVIGVEHILGRAAHGTLVGAGRRRGKQLVESLGLSGAGLDGVQEALDEALGPNGTRLCRVRRVEVNDGGDEVVVYLSETICSAGEPQGSERKLTFTLGAIRGAVEEVTGKTFRVKQTGSVLRGQDYDIVTLSR
ncbi:MAG: hypothetical protein KTR31_40670 [Myxococcales bacterium]|nr:hypothetical protein [Myxococcales bacterium]